MTDAYSAAEVRVTDAAASVATAGAIGATTNVTVWLSPVGFPIELGWRATAVYSPHGSGGLARADTHLPPPASPSAEASTAPATLGPA